MGLRTFCGMKIFEQIIPMMLNIEFNISAISTDFQTCQKSCDSLNGYIPFYSEVDLIHNKLYINGSLARNNFTIFDQKRRVGSDDKGLRFFISANFDYTKQIWKSGLFEIKENQWDTSEVPEYKFPIEGNGSDYMK